MRFQAGPDPISPSDSQVGARQRSSLARWLVVLLMLALFAQLCLSAPHLSMTSDEPSHIVAGLTYLITGELWVPPLHGHPPLINALTAWPLLLQPERPTLQNLDGWGFAFSSYVRATWPLLGPIERVAFVTRLPVMLLALLLAALVFRWATELLGAPAAVLAVAVLTFDPNLLAHAQLNTTDLGVTLTGLVTVYLAWRAAQSRTLRQRWTNVLLSGLFLGLTMAGKGSGFVYAPALPAILAWGYAPTWRQRRWAGLLRLLAQSAALGGIAILTLWSVYRFQVGPWPGKGLIVPFPSHFGLWDIIFRDTARIAFLNGETKVGGWWWYFFYSTLIKTPLPLLIGLGVTLIACTWQGRHFWWKTFPLLLVPLLYGAVAIRSGMNIGHRHLLPIWPFLYIWLGQMAIVVLPRFHVIGRGLAAALMIWYVAETITISPFYLAYFNQLVGGPQNGHFHLADSNVDWGQSFIALRKYMEREAIDQVRLSYYTYVDPAVYGVRYDPLPPALGVTEGVISRFAPQPAVYAISATPLHGVMTAQTDLYDWFRHHKPDAQIGYGLLIYDIEPQDVVVDWVAQCTQPIAPLPSPEVAVGEGKTVRIAYFDCTTAWLYPNAGATPGHFILVRDEAMLNRPFVQAKLGTATLSYEQRLPGALPAFVVYAQPAIEPRIPTSQFVQAAFSEGTPLQALADGTELVPPVILNGPLEFLGAALNADTDQSGDAVALDTFWRVANSPKDRWLSVMAHLLDDDGRLVAGGDGLGVPIDQWEVGDLIVQHHTLDLPPGTTGRFWLQTGVYWSDSLERWQILHQGSVVGDRLLVGEIQLEP